MRGPLTVFYDASCPVCANEMHALRALAQDDRLRLVDSSDPRLDVAAFGPDAPSRDAMLSRIRARDADGRWLEGIDVFEAAYRAAGLERAAQVWGNGLLKPLWRLLYPLVADNRQLLSRLGASSLIRRLIPKPKPSCTRCVTGSATAPGGSATAR